MKKVLLIAALAVFLFSCNNNTVDKGRLTVTGQIKNAPDQKIYLEEIYFSQKDPETLDTAELKGGNFTTTTLAPEEGLFRIRLEKNDSTSFIFINDNNNIGFSADMNNLSLQQTAFNSPVNLSLKSFMAAADQQQNMLAKQSEEVKRLQLQKIQTTPPSNATDSILNVETKKYDSTNNSYKKFILDKINSATDPILALFIFAGYTQTMDPTELQKTVASLTTRFAKNETVTSVAAQYNQALTQYNAVPHVGSMAPNIAMRDTSGAGFSLSSLRGKYVLVDFWASWCPPCRAENPNVLKAYNQFKDKNFTVFSISLDKDKQQWEKAINADKLVWQQVSDLKEWSSPVVTLYGFDSIPYNVLIDPQGKIIAIALHGEDLEAKLAEVLK